MPPVIAPDLLGSLLGSISLDTLHLESASRLDNREQRVLTVACTITCVLRSG